MSRAPWIMLAAVSAARFYTVLVEAPDTERIRHILHAFFPLWGHLQGDLSHLLMLLPFGSASRVSASELCLQLSDFCSSIVNSVLWHDCD